jgi:acetate kinase
MGLTPMEGLIMGTRSGDIDPGLVLHLQTALGMPAAQVNDLLNHRSGLLGLSGASGDLREVEAAAESGNARAQLALEAFAYRVRKYIGAYAAALSGLNAIAFTGGIGEHSAQMRARICHGLEWLGLVIDSSRNTVSNSGCSCVSSAATEMQVWVIPTDEEGEIARQLYALLKR